MQNTKCAMYIGSNAAEAHPVSMLQHAACEGTGANDRGGSAFHANRSESRRVRAHPLRHGHSFCSACCTSFQERLGKTRSTSMIGFYGMQQVKEEALKKWTPEEVHNVPA